MFSFVSSLAGYLLGAVLIFFTMSAAASLAMFLTLAILVIVVYRVVSGIAKNVRSSLSRT